jgi:hypothetical protein
MTMSCCDGVLVFVLIANNLDRRLYASEHILRASSLNLAPRYHNHDKLLRISSSLPPRLSDQ